MTGDADRKAETAAAFGGRSTGYASSEAHRDGADLETLVDWASGSTRALDVATGAGHTAGALRAAGVERVVAMDASTPMVTTATVAFEGLDGVVGDAEQLPFAAGTFDAVTCRIAAHHFPDPRAFVDEVARVLAPGGTFALEDNVVPSDRTLGRFLNDLERSRDPTHVVSYPLPTWMEWIEANGFTVEETRRLSKRLAFEPWVERSSLDATGVERVARRLREAPASAVEAFGIEVTDGEVVGFESPKGLLRAVRPG